MKIKPGAKLSNSLQPEILCIFPIIENLCGKYGVEFVITEGVGGRHREDSKHYEGMAIDMRSRDFPDGSTGTVCSSFCHELRELLGSDYDIVMESNHIHIEYDKK